MVEPYLYDNLNQIYDFFFFTFNIIILKGMSLRNVIENCLQDNKLISSVHLRLYLADIKIICSFYFIWHTAQLHTRKFYDGHK